MKIRNGCLILICFSLILFFISTLTFQCKNIGKINGLLQEEAMLEALQQQEISTQLVKNFQKWEDGEFTQYDYLAGYLLTKEEEQKSLQAQIKIFRTHKPQEFSALSRYVTAIWKDASYFPVPVSVTDKKATVNFTNSWMFPRTYGGDRSHEGCDIMAKINQRGKYPVISMTDGIVEKVGWLPLGGYRLGIRAPSGGYFYYAHLFDYAKEFQPGDNIRSGELLGFMGDSGYGEEGTIGKFDVHLHLGIYIVLENGEEISVNPYSLLKTLEDQKLQYDF